MTKKRFSKKVADYISKGLLKMSYDELVQVRSEVGWLDQTNCWYLEYHLRDILIELLDVDIRHKQKELEGERKEQKFTGTITAPDEKITGWIINLDSGDEG